MSNYPPSRLLGVHSGALGDVVLFVQLLSALRGPGEALSLAAGGQKARLLRVLAAVDEALDLSILPMEELFASDPPTRPLLPQRLGGAGRVVSCLTEPGSGPEDRLRAVTGAQWLASLPIRPPPENAGHLVDLWAHLLDLPPLPLPHWSAPGPLRRAARDVLSAAGVANGRFVALHPGAGTPAKCWPVERFADLVAQLDLPAVVLLGPVELERLAEPARLALARSATVLADPSLETLAGVLAEAAVFIGNDSGPSHLAAALGTPTLALFGPTRPEHFAPRGLRVRTLRHEPLSEMPVALVAAAARHSRRA